MSHNLNQEHSLVSE